jgi:hypothetical protein
VVIFGSDTAYESETYCHERVDTFQRGVTAGDEFIFEFPPGAWLLYTIGIALSDDMLVRMKPFTRTIVARNDSVWKLALLTASW